MNRLSLGVLGVMFLICCFGAYKSVEQTRTYQKWCSDLGGRTHRMKDGLVCLSKRAEIECRNYIFSQCQ